MSYIVSLIIPVYNAEKYLEQCLSSVIRQTIFSNMEIIIVNDGSSDNSQEIINRYAKEYKNIHVFIQDNKGIAIARQRGIKESSGKYIAMMDNDDFVKPNMYETLLKIATENDSDYVYCDYSFYPQKTLSKQKWFKPYCGELSWETIERNTQPWNKLIRRDLAERIKMEDNIGIFGDSIYVSLLIHANKIVSTNEQLYYYRVGHTSESGTYIGKTKYYLKVAERAKQQIQFIEDTLYKETLKEYFEYRYIYALIQVCCVSAINNDYKHYSKAREMLIIRNYNKNPYTKFILEENEGKLKAFFLRYISTRFFILTKASFRAFLAIQKGYT